MVEAGFRRTRVPEDLTPTVVTEMLRRMWTPPDSVEWAARVGFPALQWREPVNLAWLPQCTTLAEVADVMSTGLDEALDRMLAAVANPTEPRLHVVLLIGSKWPAAFLVCDANPTNDF